MEILQEMAMHTIEIILSKPEKGLIASPEKSQGLAGIMKNFFHQINVIKHYHVEYFKS